MTTWLRRTLLLAVGTLLAALLAIFAFRGSNRRPASAGHAETEASYPDSLCPRATPRQGGTPASRDTTGRQPDTVVLGTDSLNGSTIALWRTVPWRHADDESVVLSLENRARTTTVRCVRAQSQTLFVKDTRRVAPGTIVAAMLSGPGNPAANIEPQGQGSLRVTVSGLRDAGEYATSLRILSPDLATAKYVGLRLVVTDRWPIPFLAILLGVLLGQITRMLVKTWRPAQEARYRVVRLRIRLARWREVVTDPTRLARLTVLEERLARVNDAILLGDAGVKALLDQLAIDVDNFGAEQEAAVQAAIAAVEAARAALRDASQRWNALSAAVRAGATAEQTALASSGSRLAALEATLQQGKVDSLAAAAATLSADLAALGSRIGMLGGGAPYAANLLPVGAAPPNLAGGGAKGANDDEREARGLLRRLAEADAVVFVISLIVATLSGLSVLYLGKPGFGSAQQYLLAVLWGFGIDKAIESVTEINRRTIGNT